MLAFNGSLNAIYNVIYVHGDIPLGSISHLSAPQKITKDCGILGRYIVSLHTTPLQRFIEPSTTMATDHQQFHNAYLSDSPQEEQKQNDFGPQEQEGQVTEDETLYSNEENETRSVDSDDDSSEGGAKSKKPKQIFKSANEEFFQDL